MKTVQHLIQSKSNLCTENSEAFARLVSEALLGSSGPRLAEIVGEAMLDPDRAVEMLVEVAIAKNEPGLCGHWLNSSNFLLLAERLTTAQPSSPRCRSIMRLLVGLLVRGLVSLPLILQCLGEEEALEQRWRKVEEASMAKFEQSHMALPRELSEEEKKEQHLLDRSCF